MMMCGGMPWLLFWMFLGTLLFIALIVAVIWLLVRTFRSPRLPADPPSWQRQNPQPYQRGYTSPVSGAETYEEGGHTYPYSEQASALHPQTPQKQWEQQEQPPSV